MQKDYPNCNNFLGGINAILFRLGFKCYWGATIHFIPFHNQNYTRLETIYGPCSETPKTSNQAQEVREGEKTVEELQASEPQKPY